MGTGDPAGNEPAPAGEVAESVRTALPATVAAKCLTVPPLRRSAKAGVFSCSNLRRGSTRCGTREPYPDSLGTLQNDRNDCGAQLSVGGELGRIGANNRIWTWRANAAYRSELRLVIGYRLVAPRLPIEAARLHKTSTRSLELTVPSVEILAR